MSLFSGWVLAPLVLALLCAGLGLLVERIGRVSLPGPLMIVVGFAALIVVAGVPTCWDSTAGLTVPLVALLAVAGLLLGRAWEDDRLRAARWPLVAAGGAYLLFAAPSLGSGQGSVAGYIKLDDSGTWMALTDQVMAHGRNLGANQISSFASTVSSWPNYPVGSFLPFGVVARLTGQDFLSVYQPVIAFSAGLLALGLYTCARTVLRTRLLAAATALIGVQASLFLGYTQWGGIKEAVTAALLPALAILAVRRALLPLVVVAGALLGALGLNAGAWIAPAFVVAALGLAQVWRTVRPRDAVVAATALVVGFIPVLVTLNFARNTTGGDISAQNELGNLLHPLPLLQGAGLWPVGDFRLTPDPHWMAVALALAGLALAIAGVATATRSRSWELPAMVGIAVVGTTGAVIIGAPWIDAKALAVVSPVLLAATTMFVLRGFEQKDTIAPVAATAATMLLIAGCAWSTLAIARDVYVAPRARLAELRDFAKLIDGRGPTVLLDFELYGDRHLLRGALAEGATDLRSRQIAKTDGTLFPKLTTAEVDDVGTQGLWVYRNIVRRRTPVGSRPPTAFKLLRAGRYWEVWTREASAPPPLFHLALGDDLNPEAVPSCTAIAQLSRTPGVRALSASRHQPPVVAVLNNATLPTAWLTPNGVRPLVDGTALLAVKVPRTGTWRVWVGGSVLGQLKVSVDGHPVGSLRHDLAYSGQWMRFGALRLTAGAHVIALTYARGWRPGRGAQNDQLALGPVALSSVQASRLIEVAPRDYRRLCNSGAYDWVEALA